MDETPVARIEVVNNNKTAKIKFSFISILSKCFNGFHNFHVRGFQVSQPKSNLAGSYLAGIGLCM